MQCPNCLKQMQLIHRYDVEVDHCPTCKGVWLDRGEIDEIARIQTTYGKVPYKKYQYAHKGNDHDDYIVNYKKRKKVAYFGVI